MDKNTTLYDLVKSVDNVPESAGVDKREAMLRVFNGFAESNALARQVIGGTITFHDEWKKHYQPFLDGDTSVLYPFFDREAKAAVAPLNSCIGDWGPYNSFKQFTYNLPTIIFSAIGIGILSFFNSVHKRTDNNLAESIQQADKLPSEEAEQYFKSQSLIITNPAEYKKVIENKRKINRRDFMKLAGASALFFVPGPILGNITEDRDIHQLEKNAAYLDKAYKFCTQR